MLIISLTTREENIDGNLTNMAVFAYWFSDFFHHFDNYFLLRVTIPEKMHTTMNRAIKVYYSLIIEYNSELAESIGENI